MYHCFFAAMFVFLNCQFSHLKMYFEAVQLLQHSGRYDRPMVGIGKELAVSKENFKFNIRKHPCVNCISTVTELTCYARRSTARRESRAKEFAAMRVIFSTLHEQLLSHNLERSHCSALFIGTLSKVCI